MKPEDFGQIDTKTVKRILEVIRESDVALSEYQVRIRSGADLKTLRRVIKYYMDNGEIKPIWTTNGIFYKWSGE